MMWASIVDIRSFELFQMVESAVQRKTTRCCLLPASLIKLGTGVAGGLGKGKLRHRASC
jgi:hypothetical protein